MGRGLVALFLVVSALGVRADEELLPHDWLIVPGARVGPIDKGASEAGLRRYFGGRNVLTAEVELGEGERVWGTVVFADGPEKKLEIVWKDMAARTSPARVTITGERSDWHTEEGLTLGTSLAEVERLNGGPVTITGFGWDYSGTVTNAAGGKLGFLGGEGGLFIRLNPSAASADANKAAFESLLGDGETRSDVPAMRALQPSIYAIQVIFR